MSDQSLTLLIAVVGGIGGALLAGIFHTLTSLWTQRRSERHELDAWLRDQRFVHFNRLLGLVLVAPMKASAEERREIAEEIWEAHIPLLTVLPESLDSPVRESVSILRDELAKERSERSVSAMGWQGGYLQATFKSALGWGREPLQERRRGRGLARVFSRKQPTG